MQAMLLEMLGMCITEGKWPLNIMMPQLALGILLLRHGLLGPWVVSGPFPVAVLGLVATGWPTWVAVTGT